MQSHDKQTSSELIVKTILLLFAVGLNGLELFFPRIPFLPWFKPGLANTITIIWLIRYGTIDTLLYTLLRSWISGFYFGFSLLTLTLSLSGGLLSTLIMGLAWNTLGKRGALGTVGLGVLGALIHNSGQLVMVYFLLTKNSSVFYQIPFMVTAALIFGSITGFLVPTISAIVTADKHDLSQTSAVPIPAQTFTKRNLSFSVVIISGCVLLFMINSIPVLIILTLVTTVLASILSDKKMGALLYPFKFKYLLLFIALTYLFFSPGKRLTFLPFFTDEGVNDALIQVLRIWSWIEAGLLLQVFQFNTILFSGLTRLFPKHQATLSAGILALEYFPEVLSKNHVEKKHPLSALFSKPAQYLHHYFNDLYLRILKIVRAD